MVRTGQLRGNGRGHGGGSNGASADVEQGLGGRDVEQILADQERLFEEDERVLDAVERSVRVQRGMADMIDRKGSGCAFFG